MHKQCAKGHFEKGNIQLSTSLHYEVEGKGKHSARG